MADLKVGIRFDSSALQSEIQAAVKSAGATLKNIKPPIIKPTVVLPAGSIAKLKADLKELTKKREISVGIERTQFNASIEQAKKKIRELEKEGTQAGKKAGSFFAGNFRGNIQALGVAGGIGAIVGLAKAGFDGFVEGEQRTAALAQALENAGLAADGTAERLAAQEAVLIKTTLATDDQVRAVQAQFVSAGLTGKALEDATKGAFDYAAATGKDAVGASIKFSKAIAEGKDAIDDNGESLGKAETAFARYAGQAEKAASGPAGQAKQAQKAFGELQETLGGLIASVIGPLAPILQTVTTALDPLIKMLGGALSKIGTALAPILERVSTILGGALQVALDAILPSIEPLATAFVSILDALIPLLPPLLQLATDTIPLLIIPIQLLSETILFLSENVLKPVIGFIAGLIKGFADLRKTIIEGVLGALESVGSVISKIFGIDVAQAKTNAQLASVAIVGETEKTEEKITKTKVKHAKDRGAKVKKAEEDAARAFGPSLLEVGTAGIVTGEQADFISKEQERQREERKAAFEEVTAFERDLRETETERELREEEEKFTGIIALAKQAGIDTVELEKDKAKAIARIVAKGAQTQLEIEQAKDAATLDSALAVTQGLQGIFAEHTAIAKAAAVAQTYIQTYSAAAAALAPPPVGAGPLFGPILAGIAIASGFANIAKILAIQLPSFEVGTPFVQRTGPAFLHKGEAVITAEENKKRFSSGNAASAIARELRGLKDELKAGLSLNLQEERREFVTVFADGPNLRGASQRQEKRLRNFGLG